LDERVQTMSLVAEYFTHDFLRSAKIRA